jgi:hypothetical protein
MTKTVNFADLVTVENGNVVVASENLPLIHELMRQVGNSDNRDLHALLAQRIAVPIRQIAAYKSWTDTFFQPINLSLRDDPRVPVDDYIGVAFQTHPEGQVLFVRPRLKWARPVYEAVDAGVELPWDVMKAAGWPILQRKMLEAGEEVARQKDKLAQKILDVAVCSVSGHTYGVATDISKTSIDAVFKDAAAAGFPVRRVVINVGKALAMRGWTGTSFGMQVLPPEETRRLIRQGYLGEYGGADWYAHHSVPSNQVYFAGAPAEFGYHFTFGPTEANSDVDIVERIDLHTLHEKHAWYVGNAYNIRRLTIT